MYLIWNTSSVRNMQRVKDAAMLIMTIQNYIYLVAAIAKDNSEE